MVPLKKPLPKLNPNPPPNLTLFQNESCESWAFVVLVLKLKTI